MADTGNTTEVLTISVLRIRNLIGQKGENVQALIRLEFGEKILGESAKFECSPENPTDINFNTTMTIACDDPLALDDLACKPLLCTVVEVLPKEKRQKEEKTVLLGQCSFDLTPMLIGELKHEATMPISPATASVLENLPAGHPRPELDIQLTVNESIVKGSQLEESNIINITMESLFSPPESWTSSASTFNYVAATPIPLGGEKENIVVFTAGQMKPGYDKEAPNKNRKWAVPGGAQGRATCIGDKMISSDPIEEENGELKTVEDQEFRKISEREKLRISWNIDRRCYLDSLSVKSLRERIANCRYMPLEIFRTSMPNPVKAKGRDDDAINFHGVAYVDVSPLLYPGVKRIRGAFKVVAFSELELSEKGKRKQGVAEDAARIANGILTRNSSPLSKPKKDDGKGAGKPEKKGTSALKTGGEGGDAEPAEPVNVEGLLYVDAKSYVMLEIELHKPLVKKRQQDELALEVSQLVPPRPMFPKKSNSAEKAVDDFHSQVGVVANQLLDEFRENFSEKFSGFCATTPDATMEEKRQKLIYNLNASGKYLAFKEQLKYSVVKIVREKYTKTTNFQEKNELQAFLSELYVYLIDEMHVGLGKVLSIEDERPVPPPLTDSVQLKHFAREAEVNENFELAAKYYQERIARNKNDPDHWLDYGTFCLYLNDLSKAEECFREAISIDQRHLHALLLNGIVCSMLERNDSAETFFEAATSYEPKSILAWTLFGLFYDGIGNEIGTEMGIGEADRLNVAEAVAAIAAAQPPPSEIKEVTEDTGEKTDEEGGAHGKEKKEGKDDAKGKSKSHDVRGDGEEEITSVPPVIPSQSIYMQVVDFLLDCKAMPFTERALGRHLVDPLGGLSAKYYVSLAQLKLQQHHMEDVEMNVKEATKADYQSSDAWAILGHMKYLTGDTETAKSCYERTLAFVADASEMHSIYLRLASIYLQEGKLHSARDTFLMACKRSPSCISWLGVGIACYRMGEMADAEDALTEANILNNMDPEVWAYLCLVCLQTGRQLESEQAYKYATKLKLQDDDLKDEIHQLQEQVGFGNPQF